MNEKPRPMNENILTKAFLGRIGFEGFIISIMTLSAFIIGLIEGGATLASTMAFGTLCVSRLVHGFNCKAQGGFKALFNNKYLLSAFVIGFIMIATVLIFPVFSSVFKVITLNLTQLLIVCLLAFLNLPIIQIFKNILKTHRNKKGD